jgi:NADH-quinone oxidoreductase subunit M
MATESFYAILLSFVVFLPAVGALVVAFLPKDKPDALKLFSLIVTLVVFAATAWMAVPGSSGDGRFQLGVSAMQDAFAFDWIPSFNIYYVMGMDGISFPLLVLASFLSVLAMWASWPIQKYVKAYCILFLLLETGMLGVFLALDFFLFYVFWEVMLLPMYFLIGVWGGPRREYAAIKFFLYTLLGSVFMLVAILMLYFSSDLGELNRVRSAAYGGRLPAWADLHLHADTLARVQATGDLQPVGVSSPAIRFAARYPGSTFDRMSVVLASADPNHPVNTVALDNLAKTLTFYITPGQTTAQELAGAMTSSPVAAQIEAQLLDTGGLPAPLQLTDTTTIEAPKLDSPLHTFNLLALAALGQHTDLFEQDILWGQSIAWWSFLLLFAGFVIKVPSVPVHTWLPDAHVEAPTPISMILAGVLLKMGGYGIIRICYPICPSAGHDLAMVVCGIGVISMVYGAFAAMAQKDFKRLVAYSSVSHMGYVVLGFGVWSALAPDYNPDYWAQGITGGMFQMIAHGISSAGMFFMVGVVYDRVHHRNLDQFGGLIGKMPLYSALSIGIFFAALGLPGLCGFIGEVFVTLSVWNFNRVLAVIGAAVVILTAGYILWCIQRVYLGAEYKGPHGDHLYPATPREVAIAAPLMALAIVFGVYPAALTRYMDPTIRTLTGDLAEWTRRNDSLPMPAVSAIPPAADHDFSLAARTGQSENGERAAP